MSASDEFRLECGACVVRSWRREDLPSLLRHGDNPKVAANMRDQFPHPYTEADGLRWLELATGELAGTNWAIEVGGEAVGGIGLRPQGDINDGTAEIGYWLGEPYWGRGIATAAVSAVTRHALATFGYRRLFAWAFAQNTPSRRVLEKCGYRLEGVMRQSAVKNGSVLDQAVYGIVGEDLVRGDQEQKSED